ncbi:outer membrane protein assembly factor BamB family protein [Stratiformator vulcanicus]|uniref:Outer membrane protein assembly factor BamB n=1 Tax=Stratiformator vulcanicus TaxID=2527980 RepID=A0A517R015_9PLAN|nr:PQQ-binding-like beta-propeller repeat protein [Stratiformator vulcanicus]QDT37164.1 Outer membrane protein assembly factor BamB [Stratiformator vulcanicus]
MFRLTPIALIFAASLAHAGDWPQILGPKRDGVAASDEKIVATFPEQGPKLLWSRSVGSGFAGVAIKGETGILFHRVEDSERVEAFDVKSGEPKWKDDAATTFTGGISEDDGPRCVPVIDSDVHGKSTRVYTFGAQGLLRCNDFATGKLLWSNATHEEFGAEEGYFGAGSTPIVIGDVLMANVGGHRQDAGIVGFDKMTGKVLWTSTEERASYSSPIAAPVEGRTRAIFATRLKCLAIERSNGKLLWEFPFGARGPTVTGASPVYMPEATDAGKFFFTASYGVGSAIVAVGPPRDEAEFMRRQRSRLLATQYATPVRLNEHLFAIDGRDDLGPTSLKCFKLDGSKSKWVQDDFGYGTLMRIGETMLAQTTNGELILFAADAAAYRELARAELFDPDTDPVVRALPAYANGRYFVRDSTELKVFQLGQ